MRKCKSMISFFALITIIALIAGCTGVNRRHIEPITISILKGGSGTGRAAEQDNRAKNLFEKANPGVLINYIYSKRSPFYDKLNELIENGKAPDIVFMSSDDTYTLIHHKDWFMDLEKTAQMDSHQTFVIILIQPF